MPKIHRAIRQRKVLTVNEMTRGICFILCIVAMVQPGCQRSPAKDEHVVVVIYWSSVVGENPTWRISVSGRLGTPSSEEPQVPTWMQGERMKENGRTYSGIALYRGKMDLPADQSEKMSEVLVEHAAADQERISILVTCKVRTRIEVNSFEGWTMFEESTGLEIKNPSVLPAGVHRIEAVRTVLASKPSEQ